MPKKLTFGDTPEPLNPNSANSTKIAKVARTANNATKMCTSPFIMSEPMSMMRIAVIHIIKFCG